MLLKSLFALVFFFLFFLTSYGQYSIKKEFLNPTVLITCNTADRTVTGSGFFYQVDTVLYLITAAHVVFRELQNTNGHITYTSYSPKIRISYYSNNAFSDTISSLRFNIDRLVQSNMTIYDSQRDIAILKIGTVPIGHPGFYYFAEYASNKIGPTVSYSKDVSTSIGQYFIGDDVFMFGFPKSLGLHNVKLFDSDRPLVRKGAVAGIDKTNSTVIIDCPSYPGNSGGPVSVVHNGTIKVMGFVDAFIPYINQTQPSDSSNSSIIVNNSGYTVVVPIENVYNLIKQKFGGH